MSNRASPLTAVTSVGLIATVLVVLVAMAAAPAVAHESQEIDGYELTFGGSEEPVITGERMWLQLRITDEDGEPVAEQAESMEWRLEKPGDADPVDLEVSEKHGEPGVYRTAVVFTEPGEYVLHVEGMVEDTEVHTHFEKTVEDRTGLDYPASERDNEASAAGFSLSNIGGGFVAGLVAAIGVFLVGRRL